MKRGQENGDGEMQAGNEGNADEENADEKDGRQEVTWTATTAVSIEVGFESGLTL